MGAHTCHTRTAFLLSILLLCLTGALFSDAQSFGQNKVQYKTFKFKILYTEHFAIYFYPEEDEAVNDVARMAERWYYRLSKLFNHDFRRRNPIILYAGDTDFQQTNVINELIGEGVGGVTEGMKNRVVIPLSTSYRDIDHVLGHELVHAFQYNIDRGTSSIGDVTSLESTPLWFVEGMAEYLSLGGVDAQTAMWMRDAVLRNKLPSLEDLEDTSEYFPYRWGQALWAYIGGRWGDDVIPRLYRLSLGGNVSSTISRVLKISSKELIKQWHEDLRATYNPLMKNRDLPEKMCRNLCITSDINVSPSLSPDGKTVAFLSQRDVFTIDLFLANTRNGKVFRKLASQERDSHFDALRFIDSSGSWSPDGKKFAFIVYAEGYNRIAIFNTRDGSISQEIRDKSLAAMYNPAWSPDGKYIAFTGLREGMTDLYLYSFADKSIRRLTNDRNADLHPAWSPDSRTIAFISDRGPRTNFSRLEYGPMQVSLFNLASGDIRILTLFAFSDHTNPQFSPDGSSLYFLASPQGFPDIFRVSLNDNRLFQVTSLATGVSGITPLSPAFTVSPGNGIIVYSTYRNSDYNLMEHIPDQSEDKPVGRDGDPVPPGAQLPPLEAYKESPIYAYLGDPDTGLVTVTDFKVADYRPSLQLDYIGLPSIGLTSDQFGTQLGGGIGALFSDMLGNHVLGVDAILSGSLKDLGGQVYYIDQRRRTNWGISASRIPYISSYISAQDNTDGSLQITQETYKEYVTHLTWNVQHPFSTFRRVNFNTGLMRIDYSNTAETIVIENGSVVSDIIGTIDAPSALNLYQVSGGLTGDTSYFGFTSPMRGRRYNISVEQNIGSLLFHNILADYRQYYFNPYFTIAMRFLHYGYYGKDAESERIGPIFIGDPTLIRGYELDSFDASESTITDSSYPQFNRMLGSRIGIANLEFRIPLIGIPQYGIFTSKYLPVELTAFADGGAAWSKHSTMKFSGFNRNSTSRIPVFSSGVATRINILGYLVAQIYWAYPFQHPTERGHFGFTIAPGW